MNKLLLSITIFLLSPLWSFAQEISIPSCMKEDTEAIMNERYWAKWNDEVQKQISQNIETYRKGNGKIKIGNIKKGTKVKIEQLSSSFIFGASAFNFNQLGSKTQNQRYKEVFGTLFNRATIPFYWSKFEPIPGCPRFKERINDTEEWWSLHNDIKKKNQPHWRRPATDPIVKWCQEHGVAIHGHPLVWQSKSWHFPQWLQYEGIPLNERQALDSLEMLSFRTNSDHCPSYKKMSPAQIAAIIPTYLKSMEEKTLQRIHDLMSYYNGIISSWDVVNESSGDFKDGADNPQLPMCKSPRYGIAFSDYIYKSFQKAQKENTSHALLNINDYVSDESYTQEIKNLLQRGCKIDVIGSQLHLFNPQECIQIAEGTNSWKDKKVNPEDISKYFQQLAEETKLPTCISEITITSAGQNHKGEMIQAIIARNLYRLWFSIPSMTAITWWNLVDDCGAPGEPTNSGIFHRDMTPKIAFHALNNLINKEWRTNIQTNPDKKGEVSWRGFKGNYRITWTDTKGKLHQQEVLVN